MSGTAPTPDTPNPAPVVDKPSRGIDVAGATERLTELLAQEAPGQPEKPARPPRRTPPAPAPAAEAEADQEPEDEGETPIDEEPGEEGEPEIEPEDEGTDEEDQEDTEEPSDDTLVTVEIDGKTEKVPLKELKASLLRTADYTRKTQALAEERKRAEAEVSAVRQERIQYAQLLPQLARQLETQQPDPAELERLRAEDPMRYMLERDAQRDREAQIAAARAEYERIAYEERQHAEAEKARHLRQESELLLKALPAWQDQERRSADQKRIREYANRLGWSDEEVAQVTNHRAVLVLYKAMKYDEAVSRKPAPAAPAPRVAAPPPPRAPIPQQTRKVTEVTRARMRLAKTHSAQDAAAVIEHLL